jgi:hypothetical protein
MFRPFKRRAGLVDQLTGFAQVSRVNVAGNVIQHQAARGRPGAAIRESLG